MDNFLGEIRLCGFNFAPLGWLFCDGSLLAIASNTALFSILGTTYGGDGKSNFALPDLRGRAPLNFSQGVGLTDRVLGERGGEENVVLTTNQIPPHNHVLNAYNGAGDAYSPAGVLIAMPQDGASGNLFPAFSTTANTQLNPTAVAGTGVVHENMPPYLCLNFIIATQGIFPARG